MKASDLSWELLLKGTASARFDRLSFHVHRLNGDEVFPRLADACRLIQEVAPWRFARIQRDIARVFVVYPTGARYVHSIEACVLGENYATMPLLDIAMAIVHEATHARLCRAGFGYEESLRPRIERICVRMEVAFARRVPGSERRVEYALSRLEHPWWETEKIIEDGLAQLRALGAPEWFITIVGVFTRTNHAIRRWLQRKK